jgi:hypothetical protein
MSTCGSRGFGPDYENVSTPWAPPLAGSQWGTVNQQLYPTLATVTADDAAYLSSALEHVIDGGHFEVSSVTANPGFEQLGGGQQVAKWWKRSGGAWMVWSDGAGSGSRFLRWSPTSGSHVLLPEWPTAVGSSTFEPADPDDYEDWALKSRASVRAPGGGSLDVGIRVRARGIRWSGEQCAPGKPSQHADGMNWNAREFTTGWWEFETLHSLDAEQASQWTEIVAPAWNGFWPCDLADYPLCNYQGVDIWPMLRVVNPRTVDVDNFHAEVDRGYIQPM